MNRTLKRAIKAARLARKPVYRHGLHHGVGAAIEHETALQSLQASTILDIGANKGQFSLLCRSLFPDADIHAFEPLADQASIFRNLFGNDPKVTLHEVALGTENGETEIHVSGRPDSSSLLPILPEQDALFPGTAEVSAHVIRVRRGDDELAANNLAGPLLIKLDVQGYELAALKGMPALLSAATYVYTEISFQELYAGQVLADELISFMREHGFALEGVYNLCADSSGRAIQADALFRKQLFGEQKPDNV